MSSYWVTSPMSSAPWVRKRARTSSMSSTANMIRRMPNVFTGAFFGSTLTAAGAWNLSSSSRPWPSGVRIIAISHRTFSSPTTRSTQRPSTGISPSNSIPSSTKKAFAASRSSTTIRTLSIRLSVMSFLPTPSTPPRCSTPNRCGQSFDDVVRLQDERRGNGQAYGLGGLAIDNQLERRRLLDRKITRLRALQDLVNVSGGTPVHVQIVRTVRHEAAGVDVLPRRIYRGHADPRHRLDEASTVRREQRGIRVQHTVDAAQSLEGGGKIVCAAHWHRFELNAQHACSRLRSLELHCIRRMRRMREHRYPFRRGNELLEELHTLSGHIRSAEIDRHSCDVAARVSQTGD